MPNNTTTKTTMATSVTNTTVAASNNTTTRTDTDILAMGRNLIMHGNVNQAVEPANQPEPDIVTIDQEQMEVETDGS